MRDLCRAREDAHEDLVRCRHRLSKMLLRRGWIWQGTQKAWSRGHRLWLRSLKLDNQADQVVLEETCWRSTRWSSACAHSSSVSPKRANSLPTPRHSSGDRDRRGGITKAGNRHARRLLIEASWHYRHLPNPAGLRKRRLGQPPEVVAMADKAMQRPYRRYKRMSEKGKPTPKIVVAIARELAGFIWATLRPLALRSLPKAA